MLGESLLVAPIFSSDNLAQYYLPAGRWTNILSGQVLTGPAWVREIHDFFSLPVLARPNSLIPFGANEQRPDYDYAEGVCLHAYELQADSQLVCHIPNPDGSPALAVSLQRRDREISIQVDRPVRGWSVVLHGLGQPVSVTGCTLEAGPLGFRLLPTENSLMIGCLLAE
jgi:alpha-D-xyloside xylohydrolase